MNKVLALFSRWYLGVGLEQRDPHFLKLETLPELIVVTHSPNPASVQKDGRSGRGLTWEFATSVATKSDAIRILEFGALSKHYDQWEFSNTTGNPFTAREFEDWYDCPGAILQPGKLYTDSRNWVGADRGKKREALWYFIGVDSSQTRGKGTARIELKG